MTDTTRFETRLTDALGRYADRVPVEVDVERLVQSIARPSTAPRTRPRLVLALVVVAAAALAGLALFGGRLQAPVPPVVVSPNPTVPAATSTPAPTASATPAPTASPAPTPVAMLGWTEQDIGSQPDIASIWRVGEWFVAAGPRSGFADDDQHRDTAFIRSRDGQAWESVPAPARGMEFETGTVAGDELWIVGRRGTSAEPKRGIWTTRDGATWQRVADVTGLDFGPGQIDTISRAGAGWLALARKWIDAENQDGFMLRSTDGAVWTRMEYPDGAGPYDVAGLVSDGTRWVMATEGYEQGQPASIEALTSDDGLTWTTNVVEVMPRPGNAAAITSGPGGFVIVGQILDGEYPHPVAWASPDGTTWSAATMAGQPDPAGETGLQLVTSHSGGYLASGYRLDDNPSFWTSVDGTSWAQVDDLFGSNPVFVQAIAASDSTYVAGGQTSGGGAFLWTSPH